jgi:hypothetical protein
MIFGNLLLFGIVHNERFGGDPQKRSTVNQLMAAVALNVSIATSLTFQFELVSYFLMSSSSLGWVVHAGWRWLVGQGKVEQMK